MNPTKEQLTQLGNELNELIAQFNEIVKISQINEVRKLPNVKLRPLPDCIKHLTERKYSIYYDNTATDEEVNSLN